MFCLYKICKTIGKVKIVNGVVAQRQLQHRIKGHRLDDPGGNVQNQKFNFQMIVNKAVSGHGATSLRLCGAVAYDPL
ncbi:hypothetical protein SDC9_87801 [bioreactor metagenome]|uniref:Uncharacterized protein n=1 Tax=bioreactor metagenome TaxID=1076179 RepID=A0A644ZMV5_9ZZZZ